MSAAVTGAMSAAAAKGSPISIPPQHIAMREGGGGNDEQLVELPQLAPLQGARREEGVDAAEEGGMLLD